MFDSFAQTRGDKVFVIINTMFLIFFTVIVLYPLILVVSSSLSNPLQVMSGNVWLFPKEFSVQSYKMVLQDASILTGYRNTLFYTVIGTLINLVMTIAAAYPLSRRDFVGRNLFTAIFVFTMFFSGGLIPTYLVVKGLGLIDTFWVMVLPNAVAMYNIIIMRTYMQTSVPVELQEAAFVDGSTNIGVLVRIVLPLSKPILAVMVLFYGVAHWNAFFNALIYLSDKSLFPLQLTLRSILLQNQLSEQIMADVDSMSDRQMFAEGIKYAVIIVASLPVLIIYPFLQRFFVKGFMVGALKG